MILAGRIKVKIYDTFKLILCVLTQTRKVTKLEIYDKTLHVVRRFNYIPNVSQFQMCKKGKGVGLKVIKK